MSICQLGRETNCRLVVLEAEDAGRAFRGAAWHRRITERIYVSYEPLSSKPAMENASHWGTEKFGFGHGRTAQEAVLGSGVIIDASMTMEGSERNIL